MRHTQFKQRIKKQKEYLLQLLHFSVGEEYFGVDILSLQKIILHQSPTIVRDTPSFIEGFIAVQQDVVPVVDLRKRFCCKETISPKNRIIITVIDDNLVGFTVDSILKVIKAAPSDIKKTPEVITNSENNYFQGMITKEDKKILLINLEKVLSSDNRLALLYLLTKDRKKELLKQVLKENF